MAAKAIQWCWISQVFLMNHSIHIYGKQKNARQSLRVFSLSSRFILPFRYPRYTHIAYKILEPSGENQMALSDAIISSS